MSARKMIRQRGYLAGNLPAYACDRVGRQAEVAFMPSGRSAVRRGQAAARSLERVRLRRLGTANTEALVTAAWQNIKR